MKCANCGKEVDEWSMKEYGIGRHKKLLCPKCYGSADDEVRHYTIRFHQRRKKEEQK